VEAETNSGFVRDAGNMAAGLRRDGFANAQQLAGQDIDRRFQAGTANQAAGLNGAQLRLGAAGQLGDLSNLGFGRARQITADKTGAGNQQQALMQAILDAGNNQYRGFTGQGSTGLAGILSALGGIPIPQSSTQSKSPGLLNVASLLLGA
jgi:hypothetical protein